MWRERVDAIKLDTLTAQAIETWRVDFIKRGSTNPLKEKSARVSANSTIGRARSLFGAEVVSRVRDLVELPDPVPFAGVKVQRVHVTHYRSGFNVETLLESAREELAIAQPEQWKIFLLGAMAGFAATKSTSSHGVRSAGRRASSTFRRPNTSGPRAARRKMIFRSTRSSWRFSAATVPAGEASLSSNQIRSRT